MKTCQAPVGRLTVLKYVATMVNVFVGSVCAISERIHMKSILAYIASVITSNVIDLMV